VVSIVHDKKEKSKLILEKLRLILEKLRVKKPKLRLEKIKITKKSNISIIYIYIIDIHGKNQ
jgi:hypothetical protein